MFTLVIQVFTPLSLSSIATRYIVYNMILSVDVSLNQYFIIHKYLLMYNGIRPSSPYTAVEHVALFTPSNDLQNVNYIRSMPLYLVKPQIWQPYDKIEPTKVSKSSRAILRLTSTLYKLLKSTRDTLNAFPIKYWLCNVNEPVT